MNRNACTLQLICRKFYSAKNCSGNAARGSGGMLTFDGSGSGSSRSGRSLPRATICHRLLLDLLVCSGAAPAGTLGLLHSSSAGDGQKRRSGERRRVVTVDGDVGLLCSEEGERRLGAVLFFLPYHRYCPSSSQHHSLRRHDRCSYLGSVTMLRYIPWD